jgi:hypothetical protein
MRTRRKLPLAGLVAMAVVCFAVGIASARRIQISNQRFVLIWTSLNFEATGSSISCPVTLEGSFHSSTISKVSGQLIGYVTSAKTQGTQPPCVGGTFRWLTETLPWHVRYRSFIGVLPNISAIFLQIIGVSGRITETGTTVECLGRSLPEKPWVMLLDIEVSGVGRTARSDETRGIPLGGGFLCEFAGEAHISGSAEMFLQGSTTTRIVFRLVQ